MPLQCAFRLRWPNPSLLLRLFSVILVRFLGSTPSLLPFAVASFVLLAAKPGPFRAPTRFLRFISPEDEGTARPSATAPSTTSKGISSTVAIYPRRLFSFIWLPLRLSLDLPFSILTYLQAVPGHRRTTQPPRLQEYPCSLYLSLTHSLARSLAHESLPAEEFVRLILKRRTFDNGAKERTPESHHSTHVD